ncbi:hypothetical protein [Spelaeicoccus albus]|uniref:Uncharacterized protein n=1 Tax=Spelaeicoccus albus TaxID=1280376 RepID=A0A7Z0AAH9_9MICO|nr:hypothetical protein [Spelaeicoccus albus]NYI66088.1 hypothetical protein [Spelaeicoccus albus]
MSASRWEKERAALVLSRSRPGTSGRRRAEVIGRRARRLGRSGTGVAATSLREDITPPLIRRMLSTDEGTKEQLSRVILVPVAFLIVGLAIGPAMLFAAAAYGLMWALAPRIGRLWAWPWFVAGVLSAVAGVWAQVVIAAGPGAWVEPWPPSLHIYLPVFAPTWLWGQVTLGLFFTALHIRRCGWQAVKQGAAPKPEKDKNGEFLTTPEHKKVKLDPLAGVTSSSASKPEPEQPAPKKVSLPAFTAAPSAPTKASEAITDESEPDEKPVFADEDDEEFDLDEFVHDRRDTA